MFENKIFILLCWYVVTWDQGAELSNIFKYVSWFRIDVICVMNGRYMLAITYLVLFLHYEPQQFHNTKCLCYMYNHYNPSHVAMFAFNKDLSAKDNSKKSGDWSIFFLKLCVLYIVSHHWLVYTHISAVIACAVVCGGVCGCVLFLERSRLCQCYV